MGENVHHVCTARTPHNILEQTRGKWSILGTPEKGAPWRPPGCLVLLSTKLWMLVENVWRHLGAYCLFLKNFDFCYLVCYCDCYVCDLLIGGVLALLLMWRVHLNQPDPPKMAPRWSCRMVRARCVHGARTVQCFWKMHPAATPLNSPHRTTPRVPISAPCSPCWHTRNFYFLF